MKRLIALLLLSAFTFGVLASYATDIGKAKTELTKKSMELVTVEQPVIIKVDLPAIQPLSLISKEVNAKAISQQKEIVANGPPLNVLEQSPQESRRIRAVTCKH